MDETLAANGLILPLDHPDRLRAALVMMRANVSALNEVKARHEAGSAISTPPKPARIVELLAEDGSPVLSEVFERYARERNLGTKTRASYLLYIQRFIEFAGDLPVVAITKNDLRRFKEALVHCPVLVPKALNGRPFSELVEWGMARPEVEKLSAATINDRGLGALSATFTWAVENGLITAAPA